MRDRLYVIYEKTNIVSVCVCVYILRENNANNIMCYLQQCCNVCDCAM